MFLIELFLSSASLVSLVQGAPYLRDKRTSLAKCKGLNQCMVLPDTIAKNGFNISTINNSPLNANLPDKYAFNDYGFKEGKHFLLLSTEVEVTINVNTTSTGILYIDYLEAVCNNKLATGSKQPHIVTSKTANQIAGTYNPSWKCGSFSLVTYKAPANPGIMVQSLAYTGQAIRGLCYSNGAQCEPEKQKPVIVSTTFCKRTKYDCQFLDGPNVYPSAINAAGMQGNRYTYSLAGLYHAVLAIDFQVSVVVEPVILSKSQKTTVVTEVYVRCGQNQTTKIDLTTANRQIACDVKGNLKEGSGVGNSIVTMLGLSPVPNVQIHRVSYRGFYGLGGLCLNYDVSTSINERGFDTNCPFKNGHNADSGEIDCWADDSCTWLGTDAWRKELGGLAIAV
ncbi:UNVERIFIED_CONTAM: hypothetical protein HDU68_010105 [Siphonaria sp. JEL0065]|nr:hypothetical protein HDU68_010105 [Siphonaria sp. JEL0065]